MGAVPFLRVSGASPTGHEFMQALSSAAETPPVCRSWRDGTAMRGGRTEIDRPYQLDASAGNVCSANRQTQGPAHCDHDLVQTVDRLHTATCGNSAMQSIPGSEAGSKLTEPVPGQIEVILVRQKTPQTLVRTAILPRLSPGGPSCPSEPRGQVQWRT